MLISAILNYDCLMFKTLKKKDRILSSLAEKEVKRQKNTIDLIASENIAPQGVLELLGSELTNKYSEGYPGKRYYPGNVYYDQIEELAKKRALKIFRLSSRNWHVNVQAYSGAVANLAVYLSVLKPGETILSMNLTAGGHLSHGSKVSFTGKLFNVVHYGVDKNYDIDYGELEKLARKHKPKMIISGASAYPKKINFEKIGKIAKKVSAYHLADISHYAGLVSAGYYPYPFKFSDFVMTTTHKSLFGPRAALIYISKNSSLAKKEKIDLPLLVDKAVFPGLQGGPHNNTIAAIAHGLWLTAKNKKYYRQVVRNAKVLCAEMKKMGFVVVGGKTESHLFLVNVLGLGMNGFEAEKMLEKEGILANRNTVFGDISPFKPSAIRIGTYAVTSKGMKEKDMKKLAKKIYNVLVVCRHG
ncbi:MAG: Serine hydroxymethyltransferase [Candidatus Wolfebacteria bacterium GW2011_GWC1_43_10]|uniref:Serine hydroxymethyltransferase n=2 Tax=Candidatus Wolfeibacteriota TaxID=1752735 RepID=A0A0G1F861_9BACT|nr:MAG: Serine hydroxymethyltransferase [Candidatus Wolfebacteria bacterium GW2011_GWC1_43_10]KKT23085.1 MAG: Serine hydroxymethyltransferase [Parcubacteria group bacterium GW2011_GWB1_43_8b]